MLKKIKYIVIALIIFILAVFLIMFYKIEHAANLDQAQNADAIVVLGAAVYAGRPSPVLKARLDHAAELFNAGLAPLIITTGGTHAGEKYSEGGVGKEYLRRQNIPENNILAEEQSLTTKQNFTRVAEIANSRNLKKIIVVSDPFHMYRANIIAKDSGLDVFTSPTRASPIFKNSWLELQYIGREMVLSLTHILLDI